MATSNTMAPGSISGSDSNPGPDPGETSGPIAVENPILSSDAEPTGHLDSPLFKKLPTEVRLLIYKRAFIGSYIRFLTGKEDENAPDDQRHRLAISTHYQLLAACRAIYHEAIETFWSKTQLHITSRRVIARSLPRPRARVYRPALGGMWPTMVLTQFDAIPAYVMANAKRVYLQDGSGALRRGFGLGHRESTPLRDFLPSFPQLQVCELAPAHWDRGSLASLHWATYLQLDRHSPQKWCRSYSLFKNELDRRVHIIQAVITQETVGEQAERHVLLYLNYTTGKYLRELDAKRVKSMLDGPLSCLKGSTPYRIDGSRNNDNPVDRIIEYGNPRALDPAEIEGESPPLTWTNVQG